VINLKVAIAVTLLFLATVSACDLRSETAKRGMEKFTSSPTPPISPTPTPVPIDPAEVITVDPNLAGAMLQVNTGEAAISVSCKEYNRVMVNGDGHKATIRGACRQVMVNGDNNQVTVEGSSEFVINGTGNTVRYSRYVNAKHPVITNNSPDNTVEKAAAPTKQ
jgi:hypothetical protein